MVHVLVVCAFFFALMAGPANPFALVSGTIPTDGPGPEPLQNHALMLFHPPILYGGYVRFHHGAVRLRHRRPRHRPPG